MIKSSMEEDLQSAPAAAGPSATDVPPAPDKENSTSAPLPSDKSEPDIIEDDYAGNLEYLKNRPAATVNDKVEPLPAPPETPPVRIENALEKEEAFVPEPDSATSEQVVPDLEPGGSLFSEGAPEREDAPGAVARESEQPPLLEAGPEMAISIPVAAPSLPHSANLAGLQKSLGGTVPAQKARTGQKNRLFIAILIALLVIFSVFLLQRKREEAATIGNNSARDAADDPFAQVSNRNDAARMQSLTTLANILAVYHLEEKADLPISPDYVKLSEDNPVSEFFKEALRRYGKSEELLRDPAGNYYAYRSQDGLSFQLSAKLEDRESGGCTADPCLFSKNITAQDLAIMSIDTAQYK